MRQHGLNELVAYDTQGTTSREFGPIASLATIWLPSLQVEGGWDESVFPGKPSVTFLSSPYTASRVIAESTFRRREAYWQRIFADVHSEADKPLEISSRGLKCVANCGYYSVANEICFEVVGLSSARNFYICGFKANPDESRLIQVTIVVNSIQTVVHRLGVERG